ncbi:unnamed protein product [Triticum turgidum subsp. durum]|uniref:CCG-binding protein 1 n=1 Tax=Triticum turgidum subsp. durum TaxID=4567 RepID=A0A9R0TY91_TRITD|nr:unnamed protein product [Triticum turgidum subsp. durum]
MLSSTALRPLSPATATTPAYPATATSATPGRRSVAVRVLRDYGSIPKREPFSSSRSILDEFFKQEKPLVQRTKDHITDYCTTLEGDDCCSCWGAYFELNRSDLRKKMAEKAHNSAPSNSPGQTAKPRPFPVPDGLPKTQEEIDEDEEALMPESPYTRLLRRMGRLPDWYTPRPDHETD